MIGVSPSLKAELERVIASQLPRAIKLAVNDLEDYDEMDRALSSALRATTYTEEHMLGDWFPEEPRG